MAEGASGSTLARSLFGTGGLFGKDPEYEGVMVPKSKEFEERFPNYLRLLDKTNRQSTQYGNRFARNWRSDQGLAEARADEEAATLDPYFNGGIKAELEALRQERKQATEAASGRAMDFLRRDLNSGRVANDAGAGSSYLSRLGLRNASDISLQAALDDVAQKRNDFNQLEAAKMGMLGQRSAITDAALRRMLVPIQTQNDIYGQNLAHLGNLENIMNSNRIFGVQQKVSDVDKFFNTMDAFQSTIEAPIDKVMSLYGSLYGGAYGGGGGGASAGSGSWAPAGSAATMSYVPPPSLSSGAAWNVNPYATRVNSPYGF